MKTIPTGLPELDNPELHETLGFPVGKRSYVTGTEGVGKSSFVRKTVYTALAQGLWVYWADWAHDRHKPHRRLTFELEPSQDDLRGAFEEQYDLFVLDGLELVPIPPLRAELPPNKTVVLTWPLRSDYDLNGELQVHSNFWDGNVGQVVVITRLAGIPAVRIYQEGNPINPVYQTKVEDLDYLGRGFHDLINP